MKLDVILKKLEQTRPVAIVAIIDEDEYYTSKVWGSNGIDRDEVIDILKDIAKKMEDQLPF